MRMPPNLPIGADTAPSEEIHSEPTLGLNCNSAPESGGSNQAVPSKSGPGTEVIRSEAGSGIRQLEVVV